MLNSKDFVEAFLRELKPWAKITSGGSNIVTRCKYCPDSRNPNNGHFYIKVPSKDELVLFHCFKCGAKGVLTPNIALEWGITDTAFITELSQYNKSVSGLAQNRIYRNNFTRFRMNYSYITEDELSLKKLQYINSRLGTNFTFDDCRKMKIVLNLFDLLQSNGIREFTRHHNIVNQLDRNFIGFLSFDNAFVNLRNIEMEKVYEGIDKRWVNYNIFNKFDNTQRFYTIPTQIDLFKPVELHIAEGAFDIISIQRNLRGNIPNAIFTSVGGSGYKGIIKYFMIQMRLPNISIHIYPDNDIDRDKIVDIYNSLQEFNLKMTIHRNIFPNEKDFGVPLNRIKEVIEPLNY